MRHRTTKGFTLLELLVTVTIIAVLTVIGVVSFAQVNKRSRDVKRKSDLEQIRSALEMYRSDNGAYPSTGSGAVTGASNLAAALVSTYMPAIPSDPTGTYVYEYQAVLNSGVYNIYCLSAHLETIAAGTTQSTCTIALPSANYNYGLKNP